MKTRRGQKYAKTILDFFPKFEIVNPKDEEISRFSVGDIVVPVYGNNTQYGEVKEIDKDTRTLIVDFDGCKKQMFPNDLRVEMFCKLMKTSRRAK
jgi:hypothetical protein